MARQTNISGTTEYGAAGWQSDLRTFNGTSAGVIINSLEQFVQDYSPQQTAAWREEVPLLQLEADELLAVRHTATEYGIVLEYKLPYDGRRPDVIVLADGAVVVLELKGKRSESLNQADFDQISAYARDLRAYHKECQEREVYPILVPTRERDFSEEIDGVFVSSPDRLDEVVGLLADKSKGTGPDIKQFLGQGSYSPAPSLVQAARELFESGEIREIWRARAFTDPAVEAIGSITREAAVTRTRHLVLVTGVPGSGKTLVGMRAVHDQSLLDLAVDRSSNKPTVPGLYLTGNGPLAEVLQYELKRAGGGGATFIRHIKNYLDRYVSNPTWEPPEHLLVFDEAQRAFSPDRVADIHSNWGVHQIASEPDLFVRICDRMPEWSVLVGLIGEGQEINVGEEEGLIQWKDALEKSEHDWIVHSPEEINNIFADSDIRTRDNVALNLDTEIRFHRATHLHEFVNEVLTKGDIATAANIAKSVKSPNGETTDGLRLYVTRDLDLAKTYLQERYVEAPEARFGLIASSRDKNLESFGVYNGFMATRRVKLGPWFTSGDEDPFSCRNLNTVVTEFGCQGLELDMALVAWGTDLIRNENHWSDDNARGYSRRGRAKTRDPFQMRLNAYRVLLTRGRDGSIIFVPPLANLDETYEFLMQCGVSELQSF